MFESVDALIAEHRELQNQLADPAVHADPARSKKLNRRYAELSRIVSAHEHWQQAGEDLAAARELAKDDEAFAAEVPALETELVDRTENLRRLLIPRDPDDGRDVIMEIKGGEGGEESALFAADLLRMYTYYAESRGWKVELLDSTTSDMGGYKNVQAAIKFPEIGTDVLLTDWSGDVVGNAPGTTVTLHQPRPPDPGSGTLLARHCRRQV